MNNIGVRMQLNSVMLSIRRLVLALQRLGHLVSCCRTTQVHPTKRDFDRQRRSERSSSGYEALMDLYDSGLPNGRDRQFQI